MKIATLAIITRENPVTRKQQVLLGLKRGGSEIGDGTLNGPGGKFDANQGDRTNIDCLLREIREEVMLGLDPAEVEKCAIITFYAAGEPSFEVHIYRSSIFSGEPQETGSMIPDWYDIDDIAEIACERMLESDRMWFPKLIQGEKFNANVYYREKAKGFLNIEFFPFIDSD